MINIWNVEKRMKNFPYLYEIIVIAIFILIPILITTAIIISFRSILKKRDKKLDELSEKIKVLEKSQSKSYRDDNNKKISKKK